MMQKDRPSSPFFLRTPIDPNRYLADLRRDFPRRVTRPPVPWQIIRFSLVGEKPIAFRDILSSLPSLLLVGVTAALLLGSFGFEFAVLGFLLAPLAWMLLISIVGVLVTYRESRDAVRARYAQQKLRDRWIHESLLFTGTIVQAQIKPEPVPTPGEGTERELPQARGSVLSLTITFTPPGSAPVTTVSHLVPDEAAATNDLLSPDARGMPDPQDLVGARVYIHYLDATNFTVL